MNTSPPAPTMLTYFFIASMRAGEVCRVLFGCALGSSRDLIENPGQLRRVSQVCDHRTSHLGQNV